MHNKKLYNLIINSISKVVKKLINESFEFDKVNKRNKQINYYELLPNIIKKSSSLKI